MKRNVKWREATQVTAAGKGLESKVVDGCWKREEKGEEKHAVLHERRKENREKRNEEKSE